MIGAPVTNGLQAKLDLELVDGRTKLGKAIAALRAQLRDYVKESTPASELLTQRIIYKSVKLAGYELRMIQSDEESHHYLPLANSLRCDLKTLSEMIATDKRGPSYKDVMDLLCTKDKRNDS